MFFLDSEHVGIETSSSGRETLPKGYLWKSNVVYILME